MTGNGGSTAPWFFRPEGDWLAPEPMTRGPWGKTLRGRLLGGLIGREAQHALDREPGFRCSRLTVDLFRPPPIKPVRAETRVVRDGNRIKVLESTVLQEDGPIAQGRSVLLRLGDQPDGPFKATPPWEIGSPLDPGSRLQTREARFPPSWESWNVSGSPGWSEGLWVRELYQLVAGEELTPLVRVAAAADVASPICNAGPDGLEFINADYSVYLGRDPRGEHLGFQPYGQVSQDGVAVATCVVHDAEGPIGFVGTTALANDRARANGKPA